MSTGIPYASDTWNPASGCSLVSEGCLHCYARRTAQRLRGRYGYPLDDPFRVTLHPDRLDHPLHWRKPRRVLVCSMGDLFHPEVPADFIVKVFEVMQEAKRHNFLVLTKRPQRMVDVLFGEEGGFYLGGGDWVRNIWLGVTAENQARAEERIPPLLETWWGHSWLSAEPLLGPIDLRAFLPAPYLGQPRSRWSGLRAGTERLYWVVAGCETGPDRRPADADWFRDLARQCEDAAVPLYIKQRDIGGKVVHLPGLDDQPFVRTPWDVQHLPLAEGCAIARRSLAEAERRRKEFAECDPYW